MKEFSIGAVLSVVGDKMMCDIGDIYEILDYMTGENLFTHQLPRAARTCGPVIISQHPILSSFTDSHINRDNVVYELQIAKVKYGSSLRISPLKEGKYEHKNAILEAVEMMGKK